MQCTQAVEGLGPPAQVSTVHMCAAHLDEIAGDGAGPTSRAQDIRVPCVPPALLLLPLGRCPLLPACAARSRARLRSSAGAQGGRAAHAAPCASAGAWHPHGVQKLNASAGPSPGIQPAASWESRDGRGLTGSNSSWAVPGPGCKWRARGQCCDVVPVRIYARAMPKEWVKTWGGKGRWSVLSEGIGSGLPAA